MIGRDCGDPFKYISTWKRIGKKLAGKPFPVQILQRRTMNTAISIMIALEDIPFQKLESSLYFFCEGLDTQNFVHEYEAQLELAEANPEKFMWGLYAFYNQMAARIKKENLYDDFFMLQHLCEKRLFSRNENIDKQQLVVMEAYISLLMENSEYIRPNKFDYNKIICGRKTTGEILTTDDKFPLLDLPGYIEDFSETSGKFQELYLKKAVEGYKKQGYNVHNLEDVEHILNMDRTWSNNVLDLSFYINEYTYDILPLVPFISNVCGLMLLRAIVPDTTLKTQLKKRKRTLPSNGYIVEFEGKTMFKKALFKETYQNNSIIMLYKIETIQGDLSGSYDTRDSYFYSVLNDYRGDNCKEVKENFMNLILFLYATAVLNNPEIIIQNIGKFFMWENEHLTAKAYGMSGKPKNILEPESTTVEKTSRKNNDAYQPEQKAIQGYIRKLPAGQHASENAVSLALTLGYDLESNETYVQPFIKRVFRLREMENESAG